MCGLCIQSFDRVIRRCYVGTAVCLGTLSRSLPFSPLTCTALILGGDLFDFIVASDGVAEYFEADGDETIEATVQEDGIDPADGTAVEDDQLVDNSGVLSTTPEVGILSHAG